MAHPRDRDELTTSLEEVHRELTELFESLPAEALFLHPKQGVWSPAENLVHLIKSVGAVAKGMRLPRIVLALRFGKAKQASRTGGEIITVYQEHLARGARAGDRYVPPTLAPDDLQSARTRILAGWARESSALIAALARWPEKKLDQYRLPHPLLGMLTIREMLFFTLYHDQRHAESVRKRLP